MPDESKKFGVTRGLWWVAMTVIVIAVIAVITVLLLVGNGQLDKGWTYAVLPIGIIAAAAARVVTIFKAGAEDKKP